jgi:hypothetical protein
MALGIDSRVAWQNVDGQTLVMDLAGGRLLGLNPVGSFIWSQLSAGSSPESITTALAERFEVGPTQARKDLDAFLAQLRDQNLLSDRP